MRIGQLAERAGVTTKAVRYYESVGLLESVRLANGYRDYDEYDVRLVREVRSLGTLGIKVEQAKPFLECLVSGRGRGDDCAAPLAVYREVIGELDARIADLAGRRSSVAARLAEAEGRAR